MKIKFKILRCDPALEGAQAARSNAPRCEPHWQEYDIEVIEAMTVLDVLMNISIEHDPTLSFRRSCRSAICGSCAMTINGFPKLACSTQVLAEYGRHGSGVIVIGPLKNYPVIKDLVVDFDSFHKKLVGITPYLTPGEAAAGAVIKKDDALKIDSAEKCIMCGVCNAACSSADADPGFIGPSAGAKAWRFVGDVREGEKRKRLERLSDAHGVWDCVRCYNCTEFCPKDVKPLEAIERLRSQAVKEAIRDNPGAKHVLALQDSVRRVGRLDEAAMTFKTLGILRSIGMIPFGMKMELHGKMPHPIIFPKIENIEEVRKIYETIEGKKGQKGG